MTLSARISAASVAMLDRILYALASPLAREIIDSLEREPEHWRRNGGILESKRFGITMLCLNYCRYDGNRPAMEASTKCARLALRRAVNKWRNTHEHSAD